MQGGTAQNKKRIIILSLILALAFVLPSFATVSEFSGDGYKFYNYCFASSFDNLVDDYGVPVSPSRPYRIIFSMEGETFLFLSEQPISASTVEMEGTTFWLLSPTSSSDVAVFFLNDFQWEFSHTQTITNVFATSAESVVIWTSHTISYSDTGSTFLSSSSPVSTDGYSVISWDGDTTGLPVYNEYFYRVSDYFNSPLGRCYADLSLSNEHYFPILYPSSTSSGWTVNVGSSPVVYGLSSGSSSGLYFPYSSDGGTYIKLFAYRESETEGPTGAVTGLTITNPPSGTSDFILYAGSDLQCSAEVTGTGDFSSAVSWSVSHGSIGEWYPTISETGLLHVPVGTLEQRIFVTCTSVSDPTFSQTVPVYIMPPAVSSVTITPSSATAAPGENIQFSALVSGSNVLDPDVTWSVGAATSPSTRITRDGVLLIGSDETSPLLGVRATSNQDGSVYSTALVTISVSAAVTGVTISPDDITLNRGYTQQFTATVTGTGSFDSSVTWQITSVYSAGTSISANGLLTVSDEQEYDYIIIKATSTADPSFSATAYVFVEDALSDPMTIDLSVVERLLEEIKNYLKTLQHIFDRPHYFREFNMYTGKLNETEEQITGLTFNFYRFMQNMEEYVGSIAYTFANGAEVQIREDTTEGFDWFSLFFGKNSSSKVEKTDFAGVSTLVNHTRDVFDTGFGFSDFFDLLDTVPFFTDEVGSQLDTTTRQFDFRDPDPFNMSVLGNREDQLEEWRNKHTD